MIFFFSKRREYEAAFQEWKNEYYSEKLQIEVDDPDGFIFFFTKTIIDYLLILYLFILFIYLFFLESRCARNLWELCCWITMGIVLLLWRCCILVLVLPISLCTYDFWLGWFIKYQNGFQTWKAFPSFWSIIVRSPFCFNSTFTICISCLLIFLSFLSSSFSSFLSFSLIYYFPKKFLFIFININIRIWYC